MSDAREIAAVLHGERADRGRARGGVAARSSARAPSPSICWTGSPGTMWASKKNHGEDEPECGKGEQQAQGNEFSHGILPVSGRYADGICCGAIARDRAARSCRALERICTCRARSFQALFPRRLGGFCDFRDFRRQSRATTAWHLPRCSDGLFVDGRFGRANGFYFHARDAAVVHFHYGETDSHGLQNFRRRAE